MKTNQMVLTVGYDIENLQDPVRKKAYHGPVKVDHYGRMIPRHAHGTANLTRVTSSTREILEAVTNLYDRIVDPHLLVRRVTITANRVVDANACEEEPAYEQLNLFTDYEALLKSRREEEEGKKKEEQIQKAVLHIKDKYGKNAILRGMNFLEGATTVDRNNQIGGHKA